MGTPLLQRRLEASSLPDKLAVTNGATDRQRLLLRGAAVQLLDEWGNATGGGGVRVRCRLRAPGGGVSPSAQLPELAGGCEGQETDDNGRAFLGDLGILEGSGVCGGEVGEPAPNERFRRRMSKACHRGCLPLNTPLLRPAWRGQSSTGAGAGGAPPAARLPEACWAAERRRQPWPALPVTLWLLARARPAPACRRASQRRSGVRVGVRGAGAVPVRLAGARHGWGGVGGMLVPPRNLLR
jgi:hypothetical protein